MRKKLTDALERIGLSSIHCWSLVATGSVLLVYLFVSNSLPASVFWSPDEGARLIQLKTLTWEGRLRYQVPYSGQQVDPAYRFYPQDNLYPRPSAECGVRFNWPIWFPLISKAPFELLGVEGLYLIPLIGGVLTTAVAGRITYRFIPAAAPLAITTIGLASPIFFYSLLFWEHTLAVLMGLIALWQATRAIQGRWSGFVLTGVLSITTVALRLEMLFYALALVSATCLAWIVHHRKKLASKLPTKRRGKIKMLIAGIISITIFITLIVFFYFADPPRCRWQKYRVLAPGGTAFLEEPNTWTNLPSHLKSIWVASPGMEIPASLGWLGLAGVVLCGLGMVLRGRARSWLMLGGSLSIGLASAYGALSPTHYRVVSGLFLPAPYLVLAFLFLEYTRRQKRPEAILLAATSTLYLALGTAAMILRGATIGSGLQWGTRYLLMLYPLAGICAAVGVYDRFRSTTPTEKGGLFLGLVPLLFLIGVLYEVRGVQEIQATKTGLTAYQDALEETHQPIVTDVPWLPAALATDFVEREFYALSQREDLPAWLDLVGDRADSFLFVSLTPLEPGMYESETGAASYFLGAEDERKAGEMTFTKYRVLRTTHDGQKP